MGTQQFFIKWSSHQTNMLSMFDQLLSNETFVDVTLVCEGLGLKAHKMILSACSSFFHDLFVENPCNHPIIIVNDTQYSHLKVVVDFMYRGEVYVPCGQLPALLKTAEILQVKGLSEILHGIVKGDSMEDAMKAKERLVKTLFSSNGQTDDTESIVLSRRLFWSMPRKKFCIQKVEDQVPSTFKQLPEVTKNIMESEPAQVVQSLEVPKRSSVFPVQNGLSLESNVFYSPTKIQEEQTEIRELNMTDDRKVALCNSITKKLLRSPKNISTSRNDSDFHKNLLKSEEDKQICSANQIEPCEVVLSEQIKDAVSCRNDEPVLFEDDLPLTPEPSPASTVVLDSPKANLDVVQEPTPTSQIRINQNKNQMISPTFSYKSPFSNYASLRHKGIKCNVLIPFKLSEDEYDHPTKQMDTDTLAQITEDLEITHKTVRKKRKSMHCTICSKDFSFVEVSPRDLNSYKYDSSSTTQAWKSLIYH